MMRFLRLVLKISLVLLVILLIAAYFTNPTKEQFAHRIAELLREKLGGETIATPLGEISGDMDGVVKDMVDGMVERENYHICSIFSVQVPFGPTYKYLGALGQFIPLQEGNPLESPVPVPIE